VSGSSEAEVVALLEHEKHAEDELYRSKCDETDPKAIATKRM
jgi:hypothetical protein